MADPKVKQLKIKTGVVKRITKERFAYEKEVEKQRKKVEQMEADKKDEYDIRKQKEVLEESVQMIPDTKKRLRKGLEDLKAYMKEVEDLNDSEEYKAAIVACEEGDKALDE